MNTNNHECGSSLAGSLPWFGEAIERGFDQNHGRASIHPANSCAFVKFVSSLCLSSL
jgi:hypothetical protein